MAREAQDDAPDTGGWINTFADLMNLLLCFFVLLFSMSTVDADKYEQIVTSMSESINIFDGGGSAIGEGPFVSSGTDQIVAVSEYFNEFEKSGEKEESSFKEGTDDSAGQNSSNGKDGEEGKKEPNQNEKDGQNSKPNQEKPQSDKNQKPNKDQNQQQNPGEKDETGKDKNDGEKSAIERYEQKKLKQKKDKAEALYSSVVSKAESSNIEDQITVNMDKKYEYVQISLNGAILFDTGKSDIKSSTYNLLSKVGDILKIYDKHMIKIEGHTDNVPISSGAYRNNMWLSTARATEVFEFFVKKKGLSAKNLEPTGRGAYAPVASNKSAKGRAQNRRVELKIYTEK